MYIYEKVGPANVIRGDSAAAQLEEHGAEDYGVFNFAVPPDPVFRPARWLLKQRGEDPARQLARVRLCGQGPVDLFVSGGRP